MTEVFNEAVVIEGSADVPQLQVQGYTTQTEPLQSWEDSTGEPLASLTGDGKFQIGDLGLSTADALIEASADLTPTSTKPKRGTNTLGRFTGALTDALTWAVHELEFLGDGGISTLQTALRAKITNNNSGDITEAEFRAGDFQAINETGASDNAVQQITALRGTASNAADAYTTKAVGVEATVTNDTDGAISEAVVFEVVTPINSGTIETLYGLQVPDLTQGSENFAIHTGQGVVHFGDHQELLVASATPATNPPADYVKFYPKLSGGIPALYIKDADGTEISISPDPLQAILFAQVYA